MAQLVTSNDLTGSFNSDPMDIENRPAIAVQAVWTGTPQGTLKLQASCDTDSPTNWTDISGASQALGGAAGSVIFNLADAGYDWIRAVYTRTSSSGVLDVKVNGKSYD